MGGYYGPFFITFGLNDHRFYPMKYLSCSIKIDIAINIDI